MSFLPAPAHPLAWARCCCRELLGGHLHLEVLRGAAAIEEAAADERQLSSGRKGGDGGGGNGNDSSGGKRGGGGGGAAKWARQRPIVLLPWGTGE